MANYCLPKDKVQEFLTRFRPVADDASRLIDLQKMDSASRRAEIAKVIGDEHAKEVNARFEQKMLLRYKFGLLDWVDELQAKPEIKKDLVDKIQAIDDRILNPQGRQAFLQDLASKKIGAEVTKEEAKRIFDLSNQAQALKDEWVKTLDQKPTKEKDFFGNLNLQDKIVKARVDYGRALMDLRDTIDEMKPDGKSFSNVLLNVIGIPKTVATGILHFSALGVQAWGMLSKKVTWEAARQQFKYFSSEENYKNLEAYIISHPNYELARKSGLGLTGISNKLSMREEALPSNYPQEIMEAAARLGGRLTGRDRLPVNVLAASGRAFTGFLNYLRFNRFNDLVEASRDKTNPQAMRDIASVVNNFTGRANLDSTLFGLNSKFPDTHGTVNQQILNSLFFAPRKMAATMQMFNPLEFTRLAVNAIKTGDSTAVFAAIDQLTGSLLATGALLYLANQSGYHVEYNPQSQDFLKIETPSGEKLDVTGGNAIYGRLMGQILTGKRISGSGTETEISGLWHDETSGFNATTVPDLLGRYVRGKLSPVAGALTDFMYGENQIGRPFSVPEELKERFMPIVFDSFINYYRQNPDRAVSDLPVLSAFLGVAVESPLPPYQRSGVDSWGNPASAWVYSKRGPLDSELSKIGITLNLPPKSINGIPLTDEQDKAYLSVRGNLVTQRLSNLVQSPGWSSIPTGMKQKIVKDMVIKSSTKMAQQIIVANSSGPDAVNNIAKLSMENKRKKMEQMMLPGEEE